MMNIFWISLSTFLGIVLILLMLTLIVLIEYLRIKEGLNAED